MHVYRNISIGWKSYLFDLYISSDRLHKAQLSRFDTVVFDNMDIAIGECAAAIKKVVSKRRGTPEINRETLEKIILRSKNRKTVILEAHGIVINNHWYYTENLEYAPAQIAASRTIRVKHNGCIRRIPARQVADGYIIETKHELVKALTITSWVRSCSPQYAALIIYLCNTGKHTPIVKDAPIFYVEGRIGSKRSYKEAYTTKLLIPDSVSIK